MRLILFCLFIGIFHPIISFAQEDSTKLRYPIWTFHDENVTINGLSVGIASLDSKNVTTNGIKIELIGMGLFLPLIPHEPGAYSKIKLDSLLKSTDKKTNGVEISLTGTVTNGITTGVSAGSVGQIHLQMNGISLGFIGNVAQEHNGIQIAAFNWANFMNGFQIGLFNKSFEGKGIQIGFWNVNPDRSLPIINFHF